MSKSEQFKVLAEEIRIKSKENRLGWTPGNYTETYEAPLGSGEVTISKNQISEDENASLQLRVVNPWLYSLCFLNSRGEEIYSLITDYKDKLNGSSDYYLLSEIFECAHNSYMMTDETLKSMFEDIRKK